MVGVFFFFTIISETLLYNVVLVSAVQQSESVLYVYIVFRLSSIIGYYKILNIVPCAVQ